MVCPPQLRTWPGHRPLPRTWGPTGPDRRHRRAQKAIALLRQRVGVPVSAAEGQRGCPPGTWRPFENGPLDVTLKVA